MSYEFKSTSLDSRVKSSTLQVQIYELRIQTLELRVKIQELRVQNYEFKNDLINENSSKLS